MENTTSRIKRRIIGLINETALSAAGEFVNNFEPEVLLLTFDLPGSLHFLLSFSKA